MALQPPFINELFSSATNRNFMMQSITQFPLHQLAGTGGIAKSSSFLRSGIDRLVTSKHTLHAHADACFSLIVQLTLQPETMVQCS